MVTLSNFSSVFEIAFAINALFYLFDLVPLFESKIHERFKVSKELAKKKAEATNDHSCYPIGLVIGSTYSPVASILKFTSIIFSMLSLSLLIFSGFYPNSQITPFWMVILLLVLFSSPLFAVMNYSKAMFEIYSMEQAMEQQIREVKDREYE